MGIAVGTFVAIVAFFLGLYWLVVVRPESAGQAMVRRRLKGTTRKGGKRSLSVVSAQERLSHIPALNSLLGNSSGISGHLQSLLDQAGLRWTVGRLVLMSCVCGAAVFALVTFTTGTFLVALLIGLLAGTAPYYYVRYKASKRMIRFEELFPEAIGLIVRALRAGHAFTTGLAMAAEEISEPVGPEFRLVYDHQNFGMPVDDALKELAKRIPILDVQFFVTAVLTQREAGGNLAEILDNITSVMRDRFKVKRQVRVITAHARISGTVLALLPPAVALALLFIAPEHLKTLWTDPAGIRLLIVAVVLQVLGAMVIRKLVNIEY